jgi:rhodanese-related sulfurtransferase
MHNGNMQHITPLHLHHWMQQGTEFTLIDVREQWEHQAYNIGGRLVPLSELMQQAGSLPVEANLVFYCEKGIRSQLAIQRLEALGFKNLYNLSGGMKAWRQAGL